MRLPTPTSLRWLFAAFALSLSACQASGSTSASARQSETPSAKAHRLVQSGALLLDVRTPGEYGGGHLDGAVNIPVDGLEGRLAEVGPKDKPVVVYCASGHRSGIASRILRNAGFTQVLDLGSIDNW